MPIRPSLARSFALGTTGLLLCANAGLAACAYPRRSTPTAPLPRSAARRADPPAYLWRVVFIEADVPLRKRSGQPWDDGEGAPDPYVKLFVDGRELWRGPIANDTIRPEWKAFPPRNVLISPSDKVRIELWDDDGIRSDPIGTYEGKALSAGMRDAHTMVKLEGGATVTVKLERPQPMSGIGIARYEVRTESLVIVEVTPDSPASRAGLQEGDEVTAIDDQNVSKLGPNKAASSLAMASQRGSRLLVQRDGESHELVIDKGFIWPTM